ncbi:MAG: TIM barrel protein [Verrucomicrobiales bacterium]
MLALGAAFILASASFTSVVAEGSPKISSEYNLFARSNLVAWCIVPFDAKKRNPEERAAMLDRLQLKKLAYDYRAEHIPTFDHEVDTMKKHGIEVTAWWFPTHLNNEAKMILDVIKRHKIHPQLWVTGGGEPATTEEQQYKRIEQEVARIKPIAQAAALLGCKVGLYNHGGWFGEPENQIALIKALNMPNVGIVYNQHHGHHQVERFRELLGKMKPHLMALNINGMTRAGDKLGKKILPIGEGELDAKLIQEIEESDWRGPIGILNHTDEDAETRLRDNLEGLEGLIEKAKKAERR